MIINEERVRETVDLGSGFYSRQSLENLGSAFLILKGTLTNAGSMTRPLRIEYAGAHYHVTSRRNERKAIFRNDTKPNIGSA